VDGYQSRRTVTENGWGGIETLLYTIKLNLGSGPTQLLASFAFVPSVGEIAILNLNAFSIFNMYLVAAVSGVHLAGLPNS